jgi:phosphoglucosamine mutase
VLIRPSGTEPVLRIMVEHADPEQAEQLAQNMKAELVGH